MLKKTNIQKIDFASLYKKQKKKSIFKIKSAKDWDKKATHMNDKVLIKNIYVDEFLEKIELKNAKTLLDVGCGPGTLGLNLAKKFKKVYCLDFSQNMLLHVEKNAKQMGLKNIQTIHKSFEDNWGDVPKADILIASRCMEVVDLKRTLKLLNSHAKRVYISYKVGGSFVDKDILNILDKDIDPKPDFIYLVNVLYQMGINAKVDFIRSENRVKGYKNAKDFINQISWSLDGLTKQDEKILTKFYEQTYKYKKLKKYSKWALISYKTN